MYVSALAIHTIESDRRQGYFFKVRQRLIVFLYITIFFLVELPFNPGSVRRIVAL